MPPGAGAGPLAIYGVGIMCLPTNSICPFSWQLPSRPRWHSLVQMCGRIPREWDSLHRQVKQNLLWGERLACAAGRPTLLQAEREAATDHGWAAGWNRKGKPGNRCWGTAPLRSKQWFTPSTAIEGLLKHWFDWPRVWPGRGDSGVRKKGTWAPATLLNLIQ